MGPHLGGSHENKIADTDRYPFQATPAGSKHHSQCIYLSSPDLYITLNQGISSSDRNSIALKLLPCTILSLPC